MHPRFASRSSLRFLAVALFSLLAFGPRASAQTLPDSALRALLESTAASASSDAAGSPTVPSVNSESLKLSLGKDASAAILSDRAARTRYRRGVGMTAAGVAMSIIGSSLLALAGGTRCTETGDRPPAAMALGGLTLGLGLGLTFGGGWTLHTSGPPEVRRKHGGVAGNVALGLAIGASAAAFPLMIGVLESGVCSSS